MTTPKHKPSVLWIALQENEAAATDDKGMIRLCIFTNPEDAEADDGQLGPSVYVAPIVEAAPAMLETLQAISNDIEAFDDRTKEEGFTDSGESWDLFTRLRSAADEAIAKAGGAK